MDDHGTEFDTDCNRKRNLDRRRETSRYAARDRRGKEADIFTDLKEVVPIVDEATVTHVDRIALLRVASTLCRLRKNAAKFLKTNLCEETGRIWTESTLLESLDGFLAIIDSDGVILYITESVSIYLGLTQTDLTGRSLKEFVHPSDYEDFSKCNTDGGEDGRMMSMRMKSVISPRGRNLNLKSALFKPVICRIRSIAGDGGRVRVLQGSAQPAGQGSSAAAATKNAEVPNGTFMTRHTCDMKFSYVSETFNYVLRHESRSLMGTSFYNLVHPADIAAVATSVREMLAKGHARTPYYRLIGANDSVIWVQTEATTVNHTSKGHKGQYVICVHDLLGTQGEGESFSVGRDDCSTAALSSVHVKKELEDSPDSRKSSYDEVLQWLFRDHPNSPAPTATLFRAQDNPKRRIVSGSAGSDDPDPPLAKAALFATRVDSPESSVDDITYENSSSSPYTNNAGVEYSPLAAGVAGCKLRSSGGSHSSGGGGSLDSSTSSVGIHGFGTDFPSDPLLNPLRVSAISSTDAYTLPNADGGLASGTAAAERSDLYATLSSAGAQYSRAVASYEPYSHAATTAFGAVAPHSHSLAAAAAASSVAAAAAAVAYKESHEEFFENPDLQMLAPFVAHEDMMQLTDIHGILPDFNFADWIPADPAPLQATVVEQHQKAGAGNSDSRASPVSSNAVNGSSQSPLDASTVAVHSPTAVSGPNSRGNAFVRPIPYPTPTVSPIPKGASQLPFSGDLCTVERVDFASGVGFTANVDSAVANAKRVGCGSVEPPQWISAQQQYFRTQHVPSSVLGGCTWTDLGVRAPDSVLTFHRDPPAVQQQRV